MPELSAADTSPIEPMEAELVPELPTDAGWVFEPKWDGFRCIAVKQGGAVRLFAKSGKPLGRYFPDMVEALAALIADDFILDGELTIPVGPSLSFDALQLRLHPAASRVAKLAAETPSILIIFDLLTEHSRPLTGLVLSERRKRLESFMEHNPSPSLRLSPQEADVRKARAWLAHTEESLDGVIAKRLDIPYAPGQRAMRKVKNIRTADCVVGGFRYGTNSKLVGSLLLGLYDADGKLDHVGFTSGFADLDKTHLTHQLEALRGEGFTGNAPGGPSRWSTERTSEYVPLRHELVVEVTYDHVTGARFRHGTGFKRWRPDKAPRQCTYDQLHLEARPSVVIAKILAAR